MCSYHFCFGKYDFRSNYIIIECVFFGLIRKLFKILEKKQASNGKKLPLFIIFRKITVRTNVKCVKQTSNLASKTDQQQIHCWSELKKRHEKYNFNAYNAYTTWAPRVLCRLQK